MVPLRRELGASYAFVERNFRAVRRYWGWEVVFLVYAIVNALTVAYIAPGGVVVAGQQFDADRLVLFLVVGTVVWAYLNSVFDSVAFMVSWERWEGTIESTFMAPIRRVTFIAGSSAFAVLYSFARAVVILVVVALFFSLDLASANWVGAFAVLAIGSLGLLGIGIMSASLPLLFLERGSQMTVVVQASLLLVSGVYYPVEVLPDWLEWFSVISPATYVLNAMRAAVLDGVTLTDLLPHFGPLMLITAVTLPVGVWVFGWAERYALRHGRLKRGG